MKKTWTLSLSLSALAIAGLSLGACEKKEDASQEKEQPEKTDLKKKPAVETPVQTAPTPDPGQLKLVMSGLGAEMARLQGGLWVENFEIVADSAMKVADHPKVSDAEKKRIIDTLGKDFGAFVAMDKAVHSGAISLAESAKSKDMAKTLTDLAALQTNCVGCHTQYRTRLVK